MSRRDASTGAVDLDLEQLLSSGALGNHARRKAPRLSAGRIAVGVVIAVLLIACGGTLLITDACTRAEKPAPNCQR